MHSHLRAGALLLALAGGIGIAAAQQPADQQQDSVRQDQVIGPPEAGAIRGQAPLPSALPGASPETTPAKYSAENDAKDKQWWLDRGTALTDAQKQAIYRTIANHPQLRIPASKDLHAEPSAVLPKGVNLNELPGDLKEQIPFIKDFKYVLTEDKVLLVDADDGVVAAVIGQ